MRRALRGLIVWCAVAALACAALPALCYGLPEGRHYEMVSPLYKGGYGVALGNGIQNVSMEGGEEGKSLTFHSQGVFAGTPNNELFGTYLARRSETGWSTGSLAIPATLAPESGEAHELQPGFGSALYEFSWPGQNVGEADAVSPEPVLYVHRLDLADSVPNFEAVGVPLKRLDGKRVAKPSMEGVSPNLCRVGVRTAVGSTEPEQLLAEAIGLESDLYEMTTGIAGCPSERSLRLVGVRNTLGPHGEPESLSAHCPTELGGDATGTNEANRFNSISTDGSEVFFTTNPVRESAECDGVGNTSPANPATLFVRLNGERTLQISRAVGALCEPGELCPGQQRAEFVGADEAGTKVFFTTAQSLVETDADTAKDMYMAQIGCPPTKPGCAAAEREVTSLVQVSHGTEVAEVQGVVAVAPDGGRVYYVAHGVLSEEGPTGEAVQEKPMKGADNLYVYDSLDGSTHFIADLCSGSAQSGQAPDPRCPSGAVASESRLWHQRAEAQVAGSAGRFLLFATYAQVEGGENGDKDATRDVYRYDAATGGLLRVSLGEGGYDANGNSSSFDASIPLVVENGQLVSNHELNYRAMSEDGSRIVFETAEPLSPAASNGLTNAYEWHDGQVSLVSNGSDPEPVGETPDATHGTGEVVMTPSGNDIFFITAQGLLSDDSDGARDVYDARLGAGLVEVAASREQCPGSACRGPLVNPAPLLVPGSASQGPGENLTPSRKTLVKKKRQRLKSKHKRKSRRHRAKRSSYLGAGRGGR